MGHSIELKRLSLKVSKLLLLNYNLHVLWKNRSKEKKHLLRSKETDVSHYEKDTLRLS